MKVTQSCPTLWPHGLYSPWNSSGQNTEVGSLSLLQGIFQTQGSNPVLLHCRLILYQLSHRGSPRILEWVACPSPGDLPDPGIELGSPALQADALPAEPPGKPTFSEEPWSFISREPQGWIDKDLERLSNKILIFKSYFSLSYLLWLFILTRFTG